MTIKKLQLKNDEYLFLNQFRGKLQEINQKKCDEYKNYTIQKLICREFIEISE